METTIGFIKEFWAILGEMSPYLLLGFVVAGILSVAVSAETVKAKIGKPGAGSVIRAAMYGVPLPLCSCGVIPVGVSLRKHGAGKGASTAFLISTPQTGVDSILVTFSLLGPLFAILRPIAAFITGVAGGLAADRISSYEQTEASQPACTDACCDPTNQSSRFARAVKYAFVVLPRDIGKYLLFGLIAAAAISALLPHNYFQHSLGSGITPMLVMMAIGIPMYVCSTASVPVAASLIAAGFSPGAALVFLMTGPATNAAAIAAIWKQLGWRTAVVYLLSIAVGALAFGLLLDFFANGPTASLGTISPFELPEWFKSASAVVLTALLIPSFFSSEKHADAPAESHTCETDKHACSCGCSGD